MGLQIPPQRVAGLIEEVAAVVGIAFRPEHRNEFVAAHTCLARGGEQREQGECLPLCGGPRGRRPVAHDGQTAERPQFDHRASFEPRLIGPSLPRPNLAPSRPKSDNA